MTALGDEYEDVTTAFDFDAAKNNFMLAARYGLQAQLEWIDGRSRPAQELILKELLPKARHGLFTFVDGGQRHVFERMTAFFDHHLQGDKITKILGPA